MPTHEDQIGENLNTYSLKMICSKSNRGK